jgi:hypothetical protein
MAEEYLGRAFTVNEELEIEGEPLYLIRDIVNPVLEEFSPGLNDSRKKMRESQR